MEEIESHIQELAAASVMASATDLPALTGIHTLLQSVQASLPPELPSSTGIGKTALNAEKLIERIVLNEVADAELSLKELTSMVSEIQAMLAAADNYAGGETPTALVDPPANTNAATAGVVPSDENAAEQAPNVEKDEISDPGLVADFVVEAADHIANAEAALLKLEHNVHESEAINAMFRAVHTIKGVAGFLNLRQIGSLAHAGENLLDLVRNNKLDLNSISVDALLQAIDLLKVMLGKLDAALKNNTCPEFEPTLQPLLNQLHACAEGTAKALPRPETPVENEPAEHVENEPPASQPTEIAPTPATAQNTTATPAAKAAHTETKAGESTVKVSTDRLDSLVNAIGELVIAQAMIRQDGAALVPPNHPLLRNLNHVGKIARELQDLSMSMRMVPIQGVFQKMSRLVRDLARKAEKEIELVIIGGETELDRSLVETVSDPLIHMVRNGADHGIETPAEREKAGKPRTGRIELKAYHQAGHVVVEIKDDGRGLNKARILAKARERGLIPLDKELTEQEIFKLIFHAGLSTAEKITDVSGRGVGMDVVLRNVEALRGRIEIASTEGFGSTFTIRLPLTLAVIDGLVVKVGKDRYIVPITSIEQSLQPRAEQISTVRGGNEMCMVRDRLLPVIRLHRLFDVSTTVEDPTKGLLVIVASASNRCCLMVDQLLGQQQVVIKSLGESLQQVKGISGGAILGDGNVSLILDVPGLIAAAAAQAI